MNENINLVKILENCPEGTVLWSDNYGEVQFKCIIKSYKYHINYPILVKRTDGHNLYYTKEGWNDIDFPASCLLWPSKDCRDWSKFSASWYKKEKFDPKTLKPFDKILARHKQTKKWFNDFYSFMYEGSIATIGNGYYDLVIPYNNDTKHLIGTTDEAPDFYKYWED